MADQNIYSIDKAGRIILRKVLVTFSLLFLLITPAYGKECANPKVWAHDCEIEVDARKQGLNFRVKCPKIPQKLKLVASSMGPPNNKGIFQKPELESSKDYNSYMSVLHDNLKLDTNYYYALYVTDKIGCTSYKAGSAWTNQRNFYLQLSKIKVVEDGDWGENNGEMIITVWANDEKMFDFGCNGPCIQTTDAKSWAESGTTYSEGGPLRYKTLPNLGKNENVNLIVRAKEWDISSGFWLDPTSYSEGESTKFLDLVKWEADADPHKSFKMGVTSYKGAFFHVIPSFYGWIKYKKGEDRHDDPLISYSEKLKTSHMSSSGSTEIEKQVYIPPPPEIKKPLEKKLYVNAPVDIDIRFLESPDWITTTALEVQFYFGGNLETVIIGYDDPIPGDDIMGSVIPLSGDYFSGSLPNANFTKKGTWELRTRVLVKSGPSDNWVAGSYSDVRMFSVKIFDPESSMKMGLQPIIIKSPKGKPKWALGSNMPIKWLATGVTGRMKITLLKKNGAPAGVIADNIIPPPPQPSGQTKEMAYNWRVGDKIKGTITPPPFFKIRIEEKGKYFVESDLFEITQTGSLRRPSNTTRTAYPAKNQRQQVAPAASASATPQVKKQIKTPSKPLRVISPRNNQSFNFRADVVIKTDHDSHFPVKYELKKGNAGRFAEVKLNGGALKGLEAGNYSFRISYKGMKPAKVVSFSIKKQQLRNQTKPQPQQQAKPQTRAVSPQPATGGNTRSQ